MPYVNDFYDQVRSGKIKVSMTKSPAVFRFWARVDKDGPVHPVYGQCWSWTGALTKKGYGQFMIDGKSLRAHRYAYELLVGEVPSELNVLHHCDNPSCVNPRHLFVGSHADNHADKVSKGRQARGETNAASVLTKEQVREIRRRYKLKKGYHDPVNGQGALAREYNVTQANISEIVLGNTWRHIGQ